MTVDPNALITVDKETGDDVTFWFVDGELQIRLGVGGEVWEWCMSAEDSDWLCDSLEALRQRSKRRMAKGNE